MQCPPDGSRTTRALMAATVASTEHSLANLAARGAEINRRRDADLKLIEGTVTDTDEQDGNQ
jgi:hypothetical protein